MFWSAPPLARSLALGHSCGSSFSWRLGGVCNYYPSHGDRLATRAGEPDRHGIGRSCSLLALNGHGDGDQRCLLLELKRTWVGLSEMSANDPKADIDWYPLRTAVLPRPPCRDVVKDSMFTQIQSAFFRDAGLMTLRLKLDAMRSATTTSVRTRSAASV